MRMLYSEYQMLCLNASTMEECEIWDFKHPGHTVLEAPGEGPVSILSIQCTRVSCSKRAVHGHFLLSKLVTTTTYLKM